MPGYEVNEKDGKRTAVGSTGSGPGGRYPEIVTTVNCQSTPRYWTQAILRGIHLIPGYMDTLPDATTCRVQHSKDRQYG